MVAPCKENCGYYSGDKPPFFTSFAENEAEDEEEDGDGSHVHRTGSERLRHPECRHSLDDFSSFSSTDFFAEKFAGPVILLDHQPYEVAHKDSLGVDVQFSGHTHRGQVWPMSQLVDSMYEQSHGYRKWTHSHIWVSSGLSLWGPPLRIGTDSDFAVIDLLLSTK